MLMYAGAVPGGLIAFAGVLAGSVAALVAGMLLIGMGNSGAQLSRYAAADLVPKQRKGFPLSTMVWAGTVGAVAGPALIAPAAAWAEAASLPALSGPLVAGVIVVLVAVVAVMTMTPVQLQQHGQGLDIVGWVLSAHLIGLCALAPLAVLGRRAGVPEGHEQVDQG